MEGCLFYHLNRFSYKELEFRVYSDAQGGNGRLVLEDIIQILLTTSKDRRDPLVVTKEKIELSGVETLEYNGLHLIDNIQFLDLYKYCDDLSNSAGHTDYHAFGELITSQVSDLIDRKMVHLGKIAFQIPKWVKYVEEKAILFEDTEKIKIREWLDKVYKINVDWVATILTYKVQIMMAMAYRSTSGERPEKNDNSANIFTLKDFALIAPEVDKMLSGENWDWFKDAVDNNQKVRNSVQKAKQAVKDLKVAGKPSDAIIKDVWDVTPTSHMVDSEGRNYLYEILQIFVQIVPTPKF